MRIKRPMCVLALVFMLAVWGFTYLSGGIDLSEKASDNTKITAEGIVEDKAYKNFSNTIYIKCNDAKYIVYLDKQDISDFRIGQNVRLEGKYSNFPMAENHGQFCMRAYYRIRGYEAKIKKAEVTHASAGYSTYKDFLYNIKERTKGVYRDNMLGEHYGTISAMVLGDKTDLDDETKALYQNAGISHILSLSGLHIATVGMFVFSILIKVGLGTKLSSVVSTFIMVSYGIMTGLSTSTFRALIMFFLGILAKCIGRTYDLLSAVCVSAIIILVENPFYIYDSGFLMSFLSVIGIGIIYPVLNEVTEGMFVKLCKQGFAMKILDGVRQSVCISLAATLATLPVVMSSFYKISRYSIFVNIVIVPVMSVVLFMGILGGFAGFTGSAGIIRDAVTIGNAGYVGEVGVLGDSSLHKFTRLILKAVEYLLDFFKTVSGNAGKLPGNTWVTGKPGVAGIIVYIILILIAFTPLNKIACARITQWIYFRKIRQRDAVLNIDKKEYDKYYKKILHLNTLVLVVVAIFAISYRHENDFSVDVLSVGQGACNVIHGKDIPTIMIDAGSTDVKDAGKYRVIPNLLSKGIDEIDYLFITHPDEDHISAVKEILSDKSCGIGVDALVFSIVDDEIIAMSEEYGVPVYSFNEGQVISGTDYEIRAVYPAYDAGGNWKGSDANEKSLVLKITHKPSGFTALFTGDIGIQAEGEILNHQTNTIHSTQIENENNRNNTNNTNNTNNIILNPEQKNNNFADNSAASIKDVSFMTIAHHGSKNSSSEQFLEYTNPLISTISAGKDNSYGHPHKETLEKLTSSHRPYLITYETGEISINVDSGKVWMDKFLDWGGK